MDAHRGLCRRICIPVGACPRSPAPFALHPHSPFTGGAREGFRASAGAAGEPRVRDALPAPQPEPRAAVARLLTPGMDKALRTRSSLRPPGDGVAAGSPKGQYSIVSGHKTLTDFCSHNRTSPSSALPTTAHSPSLFWRCWGILLKRFFLGGGYRKEQSTVVPYFKNLSIWETFKE